jgi:4-amino-4-deoxy-L-arabinose transferase-like glycosyltransferase
MLQLFAGKPRPSFHANPANRHRNAAVSRRTEVALALCIGLLVIALRAPLFDLPLERDEGGYAYIAWRLAHGEVPYRDWFDQKPPGIFAVYRAALALPGDPRVAIRAAAALSAALSSIALLFLAQPLLGRTAAALAAVLLGLLSADPMMQGPIANTEIFMLPGVVAAAALFLRVVAADRTPIAVCTALGISLGIACAFKQVAAVNVPFFLLAFALCARGPRRWSRLAAFTGWMALGGLLVWGPILIWLQLRGGLAAALDAALLHNLSYASALSLSQRLANLAYYGARFAPSQAAAWILASAGLVLLARRRDRFPAFTLGGWALANAAGVSASGHYFPHYFQQLLPAVACLAAATVAAERGAPGPSRRRVALVSALALAPLVLAALRFSAMSAGDAMQTIYPDNAFQSMPALAREIAAVSEPQDTVFLFGTEPELLFDARRVSATRYIYLFPLFGPFPDALERQRSVAAEVARAQPAVLVWIPNAMFFVKGAPQFLTHWFGSFAAQHYRPRLLATRNAAGRVDLVPLPQDARTRDVLPGRQSMAVIFVRSGIGTIRGPGASAEGARSEAQPSKPVYSRAFGLGARASPGPGPPD